MSANEPKSLPFSVLTGQGLTTSSIRPSLKLVEQIESFPQQLSLPGLPFDRRRIVSAGFDTLDFDTFTTILQSERIRRVIDIRVSPSFSARGFTLDSVFSTLQNMKIEYEHIPVLSNRFIGESWSHQIIMQHYAEHIKKEKHTLRQLREKVNTGPILLLGRNPSHDESARSIITSALAAIDSNFSLSIINHSI